MSTERSVSRRGFLRATAGAAGVAGATGTAAAAEGGGGSGSSGGKTLPDFGGYLADANNGDAVKDLRGNKEVTVKVGAGDGLAFDPAGIWIDPGTTVKWQWTGQGGSHNVHATKGASFQSDLYAEPGVHFQYTFDQKGIVQYQCDPHASLGMLGAVAVGDDVPTKTISTPAPGSGGPTIPDSAKTLGVATFAAMVGTLGLGYVFLKYGGGRAEPPE